MNFFRKWIGLHIQLTILLISGAILIASAWRISTAEESVARYDRSTIIDRAREIAQAINYDASGWEARVITRVFKGDQIALAQANPAPALHYLAPFLFIVYLAPHPRLSQLVFSCAPPNGYSRRVRLHYPRHLCTSPYANSFP